MYGTDLSQEVPDNADSVKKNVHDLGQRLAISYHW
jgi:hypothetical protein